LQAAKKSSNSLAGDYFLDVCIDTAHTHCDISVPFIGTPSIYTPSEDIRINFCDQPHYIHTRIFYCLRGHHHGTRQEHSQDHAQACHQVKQDKQSSQDGKVVDQRRQQPPAYREAQGSIQASVVQERTRQAAQEKVTAEQQQTTTLGCSGVHTE
jgi:hypothetical protein